MVAKAHARHVRRRRRRRHGHCAAAPRLCLRVEGRRFFGSQPRLQDGARPVHPALRGVRQPRRVGAARAGGVRVGRCRCARLGRGGSDACDAAARRPRRRPAGPRRFCRYLPRRPRERRGRGDARVMCAGNWRHCQFSRLIASMKAPPSLVVHNRALHILNPFHSRRPSISLCVKSPSNEIHTAAFHLPQSTLSMLTSNMPFSFWFSRHMPTVATPSDSSMPS
mmetsp:Transcript_24268/g.84290  ORF Transcript_24268/g.84290 Transcript_24268/m.84290 type:complete len:223 (-) Transcript_24268:507-1175(-)